MPKSAFIGRHVWIAASLYCGCLPRLPVGGGTQTMSGSNQIVREPRCFSAFAIGLEHMATQWLTVGRPVLGLVARRDGSAHAGQLPRWIRKMNPSPDLCATKPPRSRRWHASHRAETGDRRSRAAILHHSLATLSMNGRRHRSSTGIPSHAAGATTPERQHPKIDGRFRYRMIEGSLVLWASASRESNFLLKTVY